MLEIVVVYLLARHNGQLVEGKGYSGTRYRWQTVGLWFGGEICGALLGRAIADGSTDDFWTVYLIALAGAVVGGLAAWQLAKRVQVNPAMAWRATHRTPPEGLQIWPIPDPAAAAIVLPGGVDLALLQQRGDWAMVSARNGFVGYVDARLLVPWGAQPAWMRTPAS